MARRRASRTGYAKSAGAALIALALLIGVSVIPHQTAAAPHFLAARLGQAVGAGVPILPALCFLVGLIFFVREAFSLSARVWGILIGYLVTLVALHLRFPAGREFLAALGRKGGGYVGALLEVWLRRSVGEPGLWTVTILGGVASILLLSGASVTDALHALLRASRTAGTAVAVTARRLASWVCIAVRAALRVSWSAVVRGALACVLGVGSALAWLSDAVASARDRLRARGAARSDPGPVHGASGEMSDLDPLLATYYAASPQADAVDDAGVPEQVPGADADAASLPLEADALRAIEPVTVASGRSSAEEAASGAAG